MEDLSVTLPALIVPTVAIALVVAGVTISTLKGRWWLGLAGALGAGVGVVWMIFGSLDAFDYEGARPLDRFADSTANTISGVSALLTAVGIGLLIAGVALRPQPGSRWELHRSGQPESTA